MAKLNQSTEAEVKATGSTAPAATTQPETKKNAPYNLFHHMPLLQQTKIAIKTKRDADLAEQAKADAEKAKAEDKPRAQAVHEELKPNTIGVPPLVIAQEFVDEFTIKLAAFAQGSASAKAAATKLTHELKVHAEDLKGLNTRNTKLTQDQTKVDAVIYIQRCVKSLESSLEELSKPHTFSEKFHHGFISLIRALLRPLDYLYTLLTGAKQTLAETADRKVYFNMPVTKMTLETKQLIETMHALAYEAAEVEVANAKAAPRNDEQTARATRRLESQAALDAAKEKKASDADAAKKASLKTKEEENHKQNLANKAKAVARAANKPTKEESIAQSTAAKTAREEEKATLIAASTARRNALENAKADSVVSASLARLGLLPAPAVAVVPTTEQPGLTAAI